ncbi:hypothetical protein [Streptomyces aurantiogriseus]|uniref:Uncharacterized protein n=1 Tax=Streptomyces aurantiogriseus TaxID=66870 RepID=A0A918CLH0_9ACTN|nr:hypothetical protein [Streptomyces aurantiogriseus]GGR27408.1 hypothetical protein GCM10010251_49130 [Streptomyces aurantiogriseus]
MLKEVVATCYIKPPSESGSLPGLRPGPAWVAQQVTGPVRNREAPAAEQLLA